MRPQLAYMPALRYAPAYRPSGNPTPSRTQVQFFQWVMSLNGMHPRDPSALDGVMGPTTTAAIRSFQSAKGLTVNGTFDAATIAALNAEGARLALAGNNAPTSLPAAHTMVQRTAAQAGGKMGGKMGVNPAVGSIVTKDASGLATGVVTVPEKVAGTISPAVADQLSKMPPAAVQSFVNDLAVKASQAEATGQTAQNATPVVQPNGTVTAAVVTAPAGWWAGLTDNQKAAWIAGGALCAVAVVGLIVYATSGK